MSEYEQAVFISYARDDESEQIVNQIDLALQQRGHKIIRDKRNLGYKGSISEFMKRIGQGNCVIVVISDKYLRSPNCMFELVEIAEGKEFHDRVFPIVLSNVEIYYPVKRLEYVKYWEIKRGELAQAMHEVDPANLQGIREDMDLYDRIRDKVSGLTSILKDMNTLTPDMHRDSDFSEIYRGIERKMAGALDTINPETNAKKLKVFLCHSSQDKPTVREIYKQLVTDGYDAWLDEEKLLPGQDWNLEIEKAVEKTDAVIVFLSSNSISKEGYIQRELRFALEIALEKPEGSIFIIPVRLNECEVPRRIRSFHYVDLFPEKSKGRAYRQILNSLNFRATNLNKCTQ